MLRRFCSHATCIPTTSSKAVFVQKRSLSIFPNFGFIKFYSLRRRFAEFTSNNFDPEKVAVLGPDLACLEWLLECGSTSVLMSDGTNITRIHEMREFIKHHGFDVKNLPKAQIFVPPLTEKIASNETLFAQRWKHVPQVFIRDVDGSDAAISDEGFSYFMECRAVRKLKLNHCDYFTDNALRTLSQGRAAKTLQDLEICLNPSLSDGMVYSLTKMKGLKRIHFYFLPYVSNRSAVLRQLKLNLPKAKITFPETDKIGYGYEHGE